MLQTDSIEKSTLELLKKLQAVEALRNTRLVGGTALALQIGHRLSLDLDFFGDISLNTTQLNVDWEQIKLSIKLAVAKY